MRHTPPSLWSSIWAAHYTPQQKALAGAVVWLVLMMIIMESGVHRHLGIQLLSWIKHGFRRRGGGIKLGSIYLQDADRVRHSHIVGSPGSGKTETTKLLIAEDIKRGRGCFIIDAKGDRELYEEVRAYCRKVGRECDLKLLSATYSQESSVWNPCGLGRASELQSKFLNANVYTESFYAKACELALLQAFNELTQAKPQGFGLTDLVKTLKYLASKQKNEYIEGLFFDFGSLAQSEWGDVLGASPELAQGREVSLLEIVQKNQILFVHLPTEGKSIQSSRIGRLLTQELILISGLRKSYPSLNQSGVFSVFIDEFDAFATDSFITFLNKGRSSNFMIHIAHQTISDLKRVSSEFAGQVLGNCNIHLIFRQDDPDDAELWSRFIGTQTIIKSTYQTQDGGKTGARSNREAQEFLISPDQIKNLSIGQCVVSVKTSKINRVVKMPLLPRLSESGPIRESSSPILVRGLNSPESCRTEAESAQDMTAENFGIVKEAASGAVAVPPTSLEKGSKWKFIRKESGNDQLEKRGDKNEGITS